MGIPLLFLFILLAFSADAQNPSVRVFEDWNTTSGTQNDFQRCVTRSMSFGGAVYYYLCGSTLNSSGNYDLLVQKKNSSGTVLWSQTYNGAGNGNDYATDIQISSGGSVYVSGTYYKNSTDSNNAIIIKYNNSGTQQWAYTYNGTGSRHDAFAAMQLSTNTLVAVGSTWKDTTNKFDFLMARVDTNGNSVWTQNWNYNNLNDGSVNLWNKGTTIYVAGGAQAATTTYKYAVVSVKLSDGSILGSQVTGGNAFGIDQVTDIQTDGSNYLYVTGGVLNANTLYDWKTIKLDTTLNIIWSASYDGGDSLIDIATGLTVDQVGNVIVTGYKTDATSGKDYVTIKYSSGGTQRWVKTFDGGINQSDSASCIVVSKTDTNKIYVSGYSYNGSSKDYWTMKYDGQGNQKWDIGFNNIYNTDDRATAIALDTLGNIIVAGQNKLNDSTHTYTTVKYIEKDVTLPDDTIPYTSNSFIYTQNRGQIWGTDSVTHPEIKYYVINSMPKIYFMDTAVSYVFAKLDTSSSSAHVDTLARVDMKFKNSNNNLRIRAMEERDDYENFFLGHIPEGRSKVPNYNQLVSFDVWSSVDVVFSSNLAGMKYYFICKPLGGGNSASQIDLFYNGADSVKVDGSGQLIIYTPLGNIIQPKAAAWQLDANGNYQSLGWQPSYSIVGTNEVKFSNFGSFNSSLPIIIAVDWGNITPTTNQDNLWWSTFYGGGTFDKFKDVKVNPAGKQMACGNTQSSNFPVTTGVIQTLFGMGTYASAIVVQFKPDNSRDWATYFGGSTTTTSWAQTQAEGLDIDRNSLTGDILITGTTSTNNLPLQSWGNAYFQNSINNGCTTCVLSTDAFIAKISGNGQTLIWSTYWGGSGQEIAYELHVNALDPYDIYIGGVSTSTDNPFPNTLPSWSAGEGFFMHFDYLGNDIYGSHIGNPGSGRVYSIVVDNYGDVVLVGEIGAGTSFPVQLPSSGNTGNSSFAGGGLGDAFITKLSDDPTPSVIWSMYYGGTRSELAFDIVSSPYQTTVRYWVIGNALKIGVNNGLPPLFNPGGGAYFDNTWNGGNLDAFVLELDINGNIPWATIYGGNGEDYGRSIAVDNATNVYITGETTSSDLNSNGAFPSPNLSGGYLKTTVGGPGDLYLACFASGTRAPVWGTYYGGGYEEWTPAVACYYNSTLYLTGSFAGSSTFPLYSGPGCTGAGTPYTDFAFSSSTMSYKKASIAGFCLGPIFPSVEEENNNGFGVTVFPNPTDGVVTIYGQLNSPEDVVIEVYDVLGQLVYQQTEKSTMTVNTQIDMSAFANGVYMINVRAGESSTNRKVILQQ